MVPAVACSKGVLPKRMPLLAAVIACVSWLSGGCGPDPFDYSSLKMYWSVAVGDLNQDGLPDIAATYGKGYEHEGFVAVYLQDPTHPGTFALSGTYSVGSDPVYLVLSDLNGDGRLDLATANSSLSSKQVPSSGVSVLLQDPSQHGQFLSASNYVTGTSPHAVAVGDLNGDGRPDLAIADSNGISALFQNPNKAGTFLPVATVGGGSGMESVAIEDLDGDGKPDLVAANYSAVVVLLQQSTMPGRFSPPVTYEAGSKPSSIAVADLDGDGKPDLAVADYAASATAGSPGLSVLLQNPRVPGTFSPAIAYSTDNASGYVAVADLNADARPDLAVGNVGSFSILLQNVYLPGQFAAANNYETDHVGVVSIATGDMNGDSRIDLVLAENGLKIRFQDISNPGKFLRPTTIAEP